MYYLLIWIKEKCINFERKRKLKANNALRHAIAIKIHKTTVHNFFGGFSGEAHSKLHVIKTEVMRKLPHIGFVGYFYHLFPSIFR